MTIEKLTDTETLALCAREHGPKALRIIDAQAAALVKNAAEAGLALANSYERAEALEAQLAEARALLRECQPWMPASRGCEASRKLDEYMRANPESPRAADMTDAQYQEVYDTMLKPGLSAESPRAAAERAVFVVRGETLTHCNMLDLDLLREADAVPDRDVRGTPDDSPWFASSRSELARRAVKP